MPEAEIDPAPDRDRSASLAERLASRLRAGPVRRGSRAGGWWIVAALAVLVWLAPLATIAGATLLAGAAGREADRLRAQAAPVLAAQREAEGARQRLGDALRGPGPGTVAEALARTLPAEARVARMARVAGGAIDLEIAAPDPDRLRAALRRAPQFARLRDMGQRAGDGEMVSRFRISAP